MLLKYLKESYGVDGEPIEESPTDKLDTKQTAFELPWKMYPR